LWGLSQSLVSAGDFRYTNLWLGRRWGNIGSLV